MRTVKPVYGYEVSRAGDATTVTYQRSKHSVGLFLIVVMLSAGVFGVIGAAVSSPPQPGGAAFFGAIVGLLIAPIAVFIVNRKFRKTRFIEVGNGQIMARNRAYDLAHVSDIVVKGPKGKIIQGEQIYAGGTGVVGAAAFGLGTFVNSMNRMGDSLKGYEDKRSGWSVVLMYGTREHKIVSDVDEARAMAIGREVHRAAFGGGATG